MEKYKLYTDGSFYKNENLIGIGGALFQDEIQIETFSELITDFKSYNKSVPFEILALKKGLQIAIKKNIKNIDCFLDDLALCQILNIKDSEFQKNYIKSNNHLLEIIPLLDHFENIIFNYIPRKQNKLADKLSRQKSLEIMENTTKELDDNFFFTENFYPQTKNKIKKEIRDVKKNTCKVFYTINTLPPVNSDNKNYPDIKIYKTIKNHTYNETHVVATIDSSKDWINQTINKISDFLEYDKNEIVSIAGWGKYSAILDHIFQQNKIIPKKNMTAFCKLKEKIKNLDSLIYYKNETFIIDLLKENIYKKDTIQEKKEYTIEEIKLGLKILSADDYVIGDNLDLETRFKISEAKKDNLNEITKKHFSELINYYIKKEQGNVFVKVNPSEQNEKIKKIKNELKKEGIKLKF